MLRLCAVSQPPNAALVQGCSLSAHTEAPGQLPILQQLAGSLQHLSELPRKRGHIKLLLQHVCPGVLNPSADADEPGEAGET